MVLGALQAGCASLAFSDHSPMSPAADPDGWSMKPEKVHAYRSEILRLREAYAGKLDIFLGLEQDYYSPPPGEGWDYLIGSVHCVEKGGRLLSVDSLPEDFVRSARQYYGGDFYAFAQDYYRLVGDVAEKTGCQIVGHFDLITKFNEGGRLFDTTGPRYVKAALDALDRLAERDVVFEINTGAMSRGCRTAPYPAPVSAAGSSGEGRADMYHQRQPQRGHRCLRLPSGRGAGPGLRLPGDLGADRDRFSGNRTGEVFRARKLRRQRRDEKGPVRP